MTVLTAAPSLRSSAFWSNTMLCPRFAWTILARAAHCCSAVPNHWSHTNLMYRAGIHALMLCGCMGVNGGGLAHYVGQEKLAPMESWSSIAFARDWQPAVRLQNAPSWHYVHTDQWRYEKAF